MIKHKKIVRGLQRIVVTEVPSFNRKKLLTVNLLKLMLLKTTKHTILALISKAMESILVKRMFN